MKQMQFILVPSRLISCNLTTPCLAVTGRGRVAHCGGGIKRAELAFGCTII